MIGKVTEAVQHPDADRLRVCTVDVGEDGPRTIVCGAPNVGTGQTVAVALPGARMPGGDKLRKAKLRGVASEGMILAADEIEIGDDHDGIMVLDDALAAGTPLAEVVPLAEPVLEIEVTPNRSDCFGVHGVAREVHAVTGAPLAPDPWADDAARDRRGQRRGLRLGHGRGPRALPALHRPRLPRREDRPLAALAAGAARRRRDAADLQHRRHHQLRDAADRSAAPRLRPGEGPRRRADRPAGEAGGEDDDARRRRAGARRRTPCWSATASSRAASPG